MCDVLCDFRCVGGLVVTDLFSIIFIVCNNREKINTCGYTTDPIDTGLLNI